MSKFVVTHVLGILKNKNVSSGRMPLIYQNLLPNSAALDFPQITHWFLFVRIFLVIIFKTLENFNLLLLSDVQGFTSLKG